MTLLIRCLLAAVAGVAVALGFAPTSWFVLLLLGVAGFLALLVGVTPRHGLLVGYVFGLAFMLVLLPWLLNIGLGAVGWVAWLGLTVVSALYYAGFGWAAVRVSRLPGAPVWAACCWVAMELLRGTVPLGGFPWGYLAYATVDTPMAALNRWIGTPVTSGAVVLVCALAVAAARRRRAWRPTVALAAGAVALLCVGLALPVGLADPGRSITVAAIQGDVPGTGANSLGQQHQVVTNHVNETLRYAAAVKAGTAPRADIVLWPENSTDIDPVAYPAIGAEIQAAVDAVGVPTLVGAIVNGPTPSEAENVGIVWSPSTGPGARYVKHRLVPFGEYVPFRSVVTDLLPVVAKEIPRDMVPGHQPGALRIGGITIGDMLCFDVADDANVRSAVDAGAQLLVVQTNNATYTGTGQPAQQWQISRVRAIESGRDLAVASINGISGMVNADGEVLAETTTRDPAYDVATLTVATGVTWGIRFGGWLQALACVVAVVALLVSLLLARRRRRDAAVVAPAGSAEPAAGARATEPDVAPVGGGSSA